MIRSSDTVAVASRRKWIFDQLGTLIRPQVPKSDEWIISVLDWLTVHGLFVVKKKSSRRLFCAVCASCNGCYTFS